MISLEPAFQQLQVELEDRLYPNVWKEWSWSLGNAIFPLYEGTRTTLFSPLDTALRTDPKDLHHEDD